MSNLNALNQALADLQNNAEQYESVQEKGHCVLLAGPGSGKTKTLTTAMAKSLTEDVLAPRQVACITYSTECAKELEERLGKLGITSNDRSFIGTVHGFALSQVISPYARCIPGLLPENFRLATHSECRSAVERAYKLTLNDRDNPHERWKVAQQKRRCVVDRTLPEWRESHSELADFIEAYETELRCNGLIDYDDMPLIAYRMIKEHPWIRQALVARYPVLYVDEYQDLGHALHELVLLLCFEGGARLFAVGDADQSIYGFTAANPNLLGSLTERNDVKVIRLKFNYRSGHKIIRASMGALGEERDFQGAEDAGEGEIHYHALDLGYDFQAKHIASTLVPSLIEKGVCPSEIGILYRNATFGNMIAEALKKMDMPFVRSDSNALVKRNSPLARFIEDCARWVSGGWTSANPPFNRLLRQANQLVYGGRASDSEKQSLSNQLIRFLQSGFQLVESTNQWLVEFRDNLVIPWQSSSRNVHVEWEVCAEMIERTDPAKGNDLPLTIFSGFIQGSGRLVLSTLHSAKGREFDVVIMFGIHDSDFPNRWDKNSDSAYREARRLFYVGVTRPRAELHLVFQKAHHSPWIEEVYRRSEQS